MVSLNLSILWGTISSSRLNCVLIVLEHGCSPFWWPCQFSSLITANWASLFFSELIYDDFSWFNGWLLGLGKEDPGIFWNLVDYQQIRVVSIKRFYNPVFLDVRTWKIIIRCSDESKVHVEPLASRNSFSRVMPGWLLPYSRLFLEVHKSEWMPLKFRWYSNCMLCYDPTVFHYIL